MCTLAARHTLPFKYTSTNFYLSVSTEWRDGSPQSSLRHLHPTQMPSLNACHLSLSFTAPHISTSQVNMGKIQTCKSLHDLIEKCYLCICFSEERQHQSSANSFIPLQFYSNCIIGEKLQIGDSFCRSVSRTPYPYPTLLVFFSLLHRPFSNLS